MTVLEITNTIGFIGVGLLLLAYFLLQLKKISATNYSYPVLNLIGSLLILFSLFYAWNFPAVIVEIAWALISIFGIIQIMRRKLQKLE